MEPRFKPGDRVRLKQKKEIEQTNKFISFTAVKQQYCGEILTIRKSFHLFGIQNYFYTTFEACFSDGTYMYFSEEWFEEINEEICDISENDLEKLLE